MALRNVSMAIIRWDSRSRAAYTPGISGPKSLNMNSPSTVFYGRTRAQRLRLEPGKRNSSYGGDDQGRECPFRPADALLIPFA